MLPIPQDDRIIELLENLLQHVERIEAKLEALERKPTLMDMTVEDMGFDDESPSVLVHEFASFY